MKITISGASGFVGRRLMKKLIAENHSLHVLSRHAGTNLPPGVRLTVWNSTSSPPPEESLAGADAVIHLAGEPVAQRWTDETKQKIRSSRVDGTRLLVQALSTLSYRPAVLICASAIGFYGSRGDEILTEASPPGDGFVADITREWEQQADLAQSLGIRLVKIRIGLALEKHGGALAKMLPLFKACIGGPIASGRQWMSWIHLDDLVGIIRYALDQPLQGPVNATAPNPVTNKEFTKTLAAAVHRPAFLSVPAFALKLSFGQMSEVLLASQRVIPKVAESAGYQFQYRDLGEALRNIL